MKVLIADDSLTARRFVEYHLKNWGEARLLKRITHPNIAHLYDSHFDETWGYRAIEFIDGWPLDKYVKQRQPKVKKKTVRAIAAAGHARRPSEIRPGFDPDLEYIMMKALADDPDTRYQTAAESGAKLRQFVQKRLREKQGRHD